MDVIVLPLRKRKKKKNNMKYVFFRIKEREERTHAKQDNISYLPSKLYPGVCFIPFSRVFRRFSKDSILSRGKVLFFYFLSFSSFWARLSTVYFYF